MTTVELGRAAGHPSRVGLGWAFFERQTNIWKRYWAWELVWLLYGVVNTLSITFIANEAGRTGAVSHGQLSRLTMFLLIGTLVWAYLSAVLDDMSLTIMWERWEGTIEHTLMAPVPRTVHLIGMSAFGVLHAFLRTSLIMVCSLPFFHVDLAGADWATAAAVVAVGSVSLVGLGILAGILPLLYPERGEQMSFMVQALVLLVSGVYYSVDVLPGWLQAASHYLARHLPAPGHPGRPDKRPQREPGGRRHRHPGPVRGCPGPGFARRVRRRRAVGQKDGPAQAPGLRRAGVAAGAPGHGPGFGPARCGYERVMATAKQKEAARHNLEKARSSTRPDARPPPRRGWQAKRTAGGPGVRLPRTA